MSKVSIIAGVVLGCTLISGVVSAQTFTAFDLSSPTPGNTLYSATVGVAFTVNSPIVVTSLGAFDAATPGAGVPVAHTLNGTIVTTIYNSLTQAPVAGLSTSFTAASPGTLAGGYLFKDVAGEGVTLAPGNYVVAFTSITGNDQIGAGNIPPPIFNEGGNIITINKTTIQYNEQTPGFVGVDRYPGGGSATQQLYGGTFKFQASTPEPGTVSLFGGLLVAGSTFMRRRMRKKTQ
ncbi:MAG: hypothetical protein JWN14_4751 [Chthonomonadales bacterium]|nr:hypothetical protein [Chthonomonadales bacterium]